MTIPGPVDGDPLLRLSVVIPVYRNALSLREMLDRLLALQTTALRGVALETIFVDDGSDDHSWDVMVEMRASHPETVSLLRLSRNFGQVSAIFAGLEASSGTHVAVLSADLQDPPELLGEMWLRAQQGNDVVLAHRAQREDGALARGFSGVAYGLARKAYPQMPQGGFDYVLLTRRAADLLKGLRGRHRFFQGDVIFIGLPTALVPYTRQERVHGKSGWTFAKRWKYFIDLVLDGSYFPIQVMSRMGILVALGGLLYAGVITAAWLLNRTPFPGWAPIMVTLLIVGGMLMVMLGIIGEYIWRIYDDIRERPLFVVQERRPAGERSRLDED